MEPTPAGWTIMIVSAREGRHVEIAEILAKD